MNSNDWPPKLLLFSMQRFIGRLAPKRDAPCNVLQPATIVPALKWIYFLQPSIPPKCCSLRLASEKSFLTATFVRSFACAGAQSSCISVHPGAAELRRNFGLLCQSNLSIPVSFHKVDTSEDCNCSLQDGSFFLLKMTFYVNDAQWKLKVGLPECTMHPKKFIYTKVQLLRPLKFKKIWTPKISSPDRPKVYPKHLKVKVLRHERHVVERIFT
jgi:hypothetical protein